MFKAIPVISSFDLSEPSAHFELNANHACDESEDGHPSSPRALSPSDTAAAKRGKASESSASPVTTTTAPELKVPAYCSGAEISDKKPKAADYEDIVNALIVQAASEYESLMSTKDTFPDTATRNKWAKKCWMNAGNVANEHYVLGDCINSMV